MDTRLYYFTLFGVSILLVLFYILGERSVIQDKIAEYDMKGEVINLTTSNLTKIGISADTDKLDFGRMVFNRTNATKILTFYNPYSYDAQIYLLVEGNISKMLIYNERILLKPNQTRNIYIKFVPKAVGNFSGKLEIWAKYATNPVGEFWLKVIG
ncbi:MAG: hypothetical protein GXN99_02910 [Candidatus Nanohaloarchaeota archaeon]|nr:hypothetical protein [Candidatus Nanohaloarchaeota archaeon]